MTSNATANNAAMPSPHQQPREFLQQLYQAAVQRALPLHNTAACLPQPPSAQSGGRTIVIGAGKAGGSMAQAVEALWPADAPLSGPTVPDASTCADALAILQRYAIEVPPALRAALVSGAMETPKPGDAIFTGHEVHMIATPQQSLQAAAEAARAAGIKAYILSDEIEGESREVGKVHAALARAVAHKDQPFEKPCVILSGGETTVTIRPQAAGVDKSQRGRGGRAGEFCMGLALALQGQSGVYALAADTDGIDGVEDNAGAFVAPDTLARARARGMKIDQYLDRNDAYGYFEPLGDLVITGPTHTNVNDFRAILVL